MPSEASESEAVIVCTFLIVAVRLSEFASTRWFAFSTKRSILPASRCAADIRSCICEGAPSITEFGASATASLAPPSRATEATPVRPVYSSWALVSAFTGVRASTSMIA